MAGFEDVLSTWAAAAGVDPHGLSDSGSDGALVGPPLCRVDCCGAELPDRLYFVSPAGRECFHAVCRFSLSRGLAHMAHPAELTGGLEAITEVEEPDDEEDTDSDEDALLSAFEDVLAGWATAARLPQRLASAVRLQQSGV